METLFTKTTDVTNVYIFAMETHVPNMKMKCKFANVFLVH